MFIPKIKFSVSEVNIYESEIEQDPLIWYFSKAHKMKFFLQQKNKQKLASHYKVFKCRDMNTNYNVFLLCCYDSLSQRFFSVLKCVCCIWLNFFVNTEITFQ